MEPKSETAIHDIHSLNIGHTSSSDRGMQNHAVSIAVAKHLRAVVVDGENALAEFKPPMSRVDESALIGRRSIERCLCRSTDRHRIISVDVIHDVYNPTWYLTWHR